MSCEEIYYLEEWEHEREVKNFIFCNLSELTQKKAMSAIKELLENGKDWKWIHYALNKKSAKQWEKFGFGLLFNWNFDGSVWESIKRDETLAKTSYEEVEEWLKEDEIERKKYEYELKLPIYNGAEIEYNRSDAQKPYECSLPSYTTSRITKLLPYIPVEELIKFNKQYEGKPQELLLSLLKFNADNQAYYDYEMARLETINHQN